MTLRLEKLIMNLLYPATFIIVHVYADSASMGQSTPTPAFDELIQYFTYSI